MSNGDPVAHLVIDVDGYCNGRVDQRRVVSATADGYRARELGWACLCGTAQGDIIVGGSVYFCDEGVAVPLDEKDPSIPFARRLHGLPTRPDRARFPGEKVMCASRLLGAIQDLHRLAAERTGRRVVVVHKGGSEGLWASQAVPGVQTVDLNAFGCPKIKDLARAGPAGALVCAHHEVRGKNRVIHCPRFEAELFARWWAGHLRLQAEKKEAAGADTADA
jgi:hypothetical protein